MNYFYARVSSQSQNLSRQIEAAKALNIPIRVYTDKASGKDFERDAYKELKKALVAGDVLYVLSLDRLGRSYKDIIGEWREITEKGCDIVVLDMPLLDTRQYKELVGTLISDIILALLSYVAENERTAIKERQREGYEAMIAEGRWDEMGRPAKYIDPVQFNMIYAAERRRDITLEEACRRLGISQRLYYDYAKDTGVAVRKRTVRPTGLVYNVKGHSEEYKKKAANQELLAVAQENENRRRLSNKYWFDYSKKENSTDTIE